jgi:hypothetical protein
MYHCLCVINGMNSYNEQLMANNFQLNTLGEYHLVATCFILRKETRILNRSKEIAYLK